MLASKLTGPLKISIMVGLTLLLAACGGSGSGKTSPNSASLETLYAAAGPQVGIFQVNSSTGSLGGGTAVSLHGTASALSIAADSQSQFLFVADAGSATQGASIHVLSIDASSGNLTELGGSPFSAGTRATPGPMVIDPTGRFLYLGTIGNGQVPSSPGMEGFSVNHTAGSRKSSEVCLRP